MKTKNGFKANLKKFIKGYGYLVLIAFSLSLISFVLNSCTSENYYEEDSNISRNVELSNFKKSMRLASNKQKNNNEAIYRTSQELLAIDFTNEIKPDALTLIKSYGITEAEIISEFGSLDSEKIALTAQAILNTEELLANGKTLSIFTDEDYQFASLSIFGVNQSLAQSDTVGGCIADAIGISAAFQVMNYGIQKLGKKGAYKLLKKIAGRTLGPIGVALAVYDFADCMGWLE
jgi:hypothetical protein